MLDGVNRSPPESRLSSYRSSHGDSMQTRTRSWARINRFQQGRSSASAWSMVFRSDEADERGAMGVHVDGYMC